MEYSRQVFLDTFIFPHWVIYKHVSEASGGLVPQGILGFQKIFCRDRVIGLRVPKAIRTHVRKLVGQRA